MGPRWGLGMGGGAPKKKPPRGPEVGAGLGSEGFPIMKIESPPWGVCDSGALWTGPPVDWFTVGLSRSGTGARVAPWKALCVCVWAWKDPSDGGPRDLAPGWGPENCMACSAVACVVA